MRKKFSWGVPGKRFNVYDRTNDLKPQPLNKNPFDSWDAKKSNFQRIDLVPQIVGGGGGPYNVTPEPTTTPSPTPTITPSPSSSSPVGSSFIWSGNTNEWQNETRTWSDLPISPTPTATVTETPTETPTQTPTETPTNTPSVTPTITSSVTPSISPSSTSTPTPSVTSSVTPTRTPQVTPTPTQFCKRYTGVQTNIGNGSTYTYTACNNQNGILVVRNSTFSSTVTVYSRSGAPTKTTGTGVMTWTDQGFGSPCLSSAFYQYTCNTNLGSQATVTDCGGATYTQNLSSSGAAFAGCFTTITCNTNCGLVTISNLGSCST